jgi:hypothetical protein
LARHKEGGILATKALDRLLQEAGRWSAEHGRRPVIFHAYDWGGYLTWHGWPDVLNWIDDRNEVQGEARAREYFAILKTDPDWQGKLAGVDVVCVDSGTALAHRLAELPATWQVVYRDDEAVLFVRRPS